MTDIALLSVMACAVVGGLIGVSGAGAARRLDAAVRAKSAQFAVVAGILLGAWAGYWLAGEWLQLAALLAVAWALMTLTIVDFAAMRLPDILTLPLIVVGAAVGLVWPPTLSDRLIGAVVGFAALALLAAAYRRIRGREGLGLGDAKLLAAAGAWLGWAELPWVVLLACFAALGHLTVLRVQTGPEALGQALPLGPALALAFWLTLLHGAPT